MGASFERTIITKLGTSSYRWQRMYFDACIGQGISTSRKLANQASANVGRKWALVKGRKSRSEKAPASMLRVDSELELAKQQRKAGEHANP